MNKIYIPVYLEDDGTCTPNLLLLSIADQQTLKEMIQECMNAFNGKFVKTYIDQNLIYEAFDVETFNMSEDAFENGNPIFQKLKNDILHGHVFTEEDSFIEDFKRDVEKSMTGMAFFTEYTNLSQDYRLRIEDGFFQFTTTVISEDGAEFDYEKTFSFPLEKIACFIEHLEALERDEEAFHP